LLDTLLLTHRRRQMLLRKGRMRNTGNIWIFQKTQMNLNKRFWISLLGIADTPQAPSPHVDRSWPKLSNVYRPSYAECRCDNTLHMQSRWHLTLHSYVSNCCNTQRSRSVLPIIVYTLVSYDTTYL
jgi:hypothetical protein